MLAITFAGAGLVFIGVLALRRARSGGTKCAAVLAIVLGVGCLLSPWVWIAYEPSPYSAPPALAPSGDGQKLRGDPK